MTHMMIEKSWATALEEEIQKPYIEELKAFIAKERSLGEVYPTNEEVFSALRLCPLEKTKVVIMGQDPYHGPGQAHGLCFSVKHGIKPPPSLVNIYKEIQADLGIAPPQHGCLSSWASQGVLLLNATLTVRRSQPKSHYGKGWEKFTDHIIELLCKQSDPLVFCLWGRSAQEKCSHILDQMEHPHAVLCAAHPSPYSASGFFGCKHFSKTNAYLKMWGKGEIDWSL